MSIENNKALIRHKVELLNQGSVEALEIGPHFVYHDPNNPQVRVSEEYKQFLANFIAAVPGRFTIEDLIAERDKVVVRWTYRGSHQGQWRGVPPTNKSVTVTGTTTYRVNDGMIAEAWQNTDILSLVQQLGLVPAPAQAS